MERMTDGQRALVQENLGLVYHVLERFKILRDEYDDYAQIGAIGLCKAASSYDPNKSKFATFAVWCINNEILMEIRKKNCHICIFNNNAYSLDRKVPDAENGATYADLLREKESVESAYAYVELMDRCRTELGEKQSRALMMTAQGYGQCEIAERLHVSQSYTSRLCKAARKKLSDDILEA